VSHGVVLAVHVLDHLLQRLTRLSIGDKNMQSFTDRLKFAEPNRGLAQFGSVQIVYLYSKMFVCHNGCRSKTLAVFNTEKLGQRLCAGFRLTTEQGVGGVD
jgi:hypothetical protein